MAELTRNTKVVIPDADDLAHWQATAIRAVDASDSLINSYFRKTPDVQNKLDETDEPTALPGETFDPVTEADRGAELLIRKAIETDFPGHGIIGEEFADKVSNGPINWIIDPIDGTRAFVAGLPTFGTLLGVLKEGHPVFGIMSQPFTGERFWGSTAGSYFDGPGGARTLKVSNVERLSDAVIASTDPNIFPSGDGQRAKFDACCARARIVRFGGDCYSYCLLAAGHIDIVIETRLQSYDIAPLIPIIEGAGGVITNWQGASASAGGQVIAAATAALHQEALEILNV